MDSWRNRLTARPPLTLGAVILAGCLAGLGALTGPSGLAPNESASAVAARAGATCGNCGIVDQVREIENTAPKYGVSTISGGRDEVIVVLLGALNGTTATSVRPRIFEVSVRMDNGSIRAVRGTRMPQWKAGDRVKFVKGQVDWVSQKEKGPSES